MGCRFLQRFEVLKSHGSSCDSLLTTESLNANISSAGAIYHNLRSEGLVVLIRQFFSQSSLNKQERVHMAEQRCLGILVSPYESWAQVYGPDSIEVQADDADCSPTAVATVEPNVLARIRIEGNSMGKRCGIRDGFYHVAHMPYVPFAALVLALFLPWNCSFLHLRTAPRRLPALCSVFSLH
jgi:hypothetical protein